MTRRKTYIALEIVVPLAFVAVIWLWSLDTGTFYFPPVPAVLDSFVGTWIGSVFFSDVVPSLVRLAIGYSIASILGVGLGVLLAQFGTVRRMSAPVIEFFRAIPPPASIPFVVLVFGIGDFSKIILIAAVCLFPVLLNTISGISGIEPTYRDTCSAYRISAGDQLLMVTLPAASPQIFAGLRTALSLSIIVMVVSEMVAGTNGIGFLVIYAQRTYSIAQMWGGIILLGLLGYLLNVLFLAVEARVLRWHRQSHATAE